MAPAEVELLRAERALGVKGRAAMNQLTLQERGVMNEAKTLLIASLCLNHSFPAPMCQAAIIREVLYEAAQRRKVGNTEDDFMGEYKELLVWSYTEFTSVFRRHAVLQELVSYFSM